MNEKEEWALSDEAKEAIDTLIKQGLDPDLAREIIMRGEEDKVWDL